MITIYLCDDDPFWIEQEHKCISIFSFQENIAINPVYSYTSPNALMEALKENTPSSAIYILDIDLKADIDGIELAQQIRAMDSAGSIIFVTTHNEMMRKTFEYKVEALDYIIKDDNNLQSQISDCLRHVIACQTNLCNVATERQILIKDSDIHYVIKLDDILFIEAIKGRHKICVHKKNALIEVQSSLSAIQTKSNDYFFVCHKAFLVNINHIQKIDVKQRMLTMSNNEMCPCAARHIHELCNEYLLTQRT